MIVTMEFLLDNMTPNGSWNWPQIAVLGETWPPVTGWMQRAVGKELSDEQAALFIQYATNPPTRSERSRLRTATKHSNPRKLFKTKLRMKAV